MSRAREVAKFVAGAEAFHAIMHACFGVSSTAVTVFGITPGPTWHFLAAGGNAIVALLLSMYAWKRRSHSQSNDSKQSPRDS